MIIFYETEPNDIFLVRQRHDCQTCKHFIYNIGNMVVINDDYTIKSIWDINDDSLPETYKKCFKRLSDFIHKQTICSIFLSSEYTIGKCKNLRLLEDDHTVEFHHFIADIPEIYVEKGYSINSIIGDYNDRYQVFRRSLEEISPDAVNTVLELIADNNLYRGEQWDTHLKIFRELQEEYTKLDISLKSNFVWKRITDINVAVTKIRNTSIGTLLVDLSDGVDTETAVHKFETMVAGENYKRPKQIYTAKMVEEAEKTIKEMGYEKSLARRFANVDDLPVDCVLFTNKDSGKVGSIFDEMKEQAKVDPKKFDHATEMHVDEFVEKVLPNTKEVKLLLTNNLRNNMVSLIAPEDKSAPSMFSWDNAFSWAYVGNITDSAMKEQVRAKGGNVNGFMRFSIMWNDESYDNSDLDAHCFCIDRKNKLVYHTYFYEKRPHCLFVDNVGILDVDMRFPKQGQPCVENITWATNEDLYGHRFLLSVHQFDNRGSSKGFKAELEIDGQVYEYSYPHSLPQGEKIDVATVSFYNDVSNPTVEHHLAQMSTSKEVWSVSTNQFIPVTSIMWSPNYWKDNQVGNRHLFFMLKGCINPETPNGFYNEFLQNELYQKNKRVFEVLGNKLHVPVSDQQLSGVGFATTKRNSVIVQTTSYDNKTQVTKILF